MLQQASKLTNAAVHPLPPPPPPPFSSGVCECRVSIRMRLFRQATRSPDSALPLDRNASATRLVAIPSPYAGVEYGG